MKQMFCTVSGIVGAYVAAAFGGWSAGITTLMIFMCLDYITGVIVAGVFRKSDKSENGGLASKAGLKGICKKFAMLLIVVAAYRIDIMLETEYIRDMTVIAFCANELISIVENAGTMGLPIPSVITKAIDILKNNDEEK